MCRNPFSSVMSYMLARHQWLYSMRLPLDDPRHDEALYLLASAAVRGEESPTITLIAVDVLEILCNRARQAGMHRALSMYLQTKSNANISLSRSGTTKHGAEEFRRLADEDSKAAAEAAAEALRC